MKPTYRYLVQVERLIDGDTFQASVDLGFKAWLHGIKFRLAKVNCPELTTTEGVAAMAFTRRWVTEGATVVVDSIKVDKYGNRWNAVVWLKGQEKSLNDMLLEAGHAKKAR